MRHHWFCGVFAVVCLFVLSSNAAADRLRPYVLAWQGEASLQTVLENTRQSLAAVGFELIGEYRPTDSSYVLVVTAPLLQRMAAQEANAVYIAAQRVAVALVDGQVQVSYPNPDYYRLAYRIDSDMAALREAFDASIGRLQLFGSKLGLPIERLPRYQYGYGMEYFEDQLQLAGYASQQAALKAIEAAFAEHRDLVQQVYQLRLSRTTTLIGVAVRSGAGADSAVHAVLDHRELRHLSQLPYEMVVRNGKVTALHPRFRLALNFPDVKMVGKHSFMQLREAPDEIHVALKLAAGGQFSVPETRVH